MNFVPHTSSNLRVFGGSSHPELTRAVAKKVGVRPGELKLCKFANRESSVQILENVRGENIYLIQTGGGRYGNFVTPTVPGIFLLFVKTSER